MAIERRRHSRIPVNWPVIIITPQRYIGGEARNISIGGAFIHCLTEPREAEPFRMAIKAPFREELFVLTAEVAWSNIESHTEDPSFSGMGVRFTGAGDDGSLSIAEMISDHLKSEDV